MVSNRRTPELATTAWLFFDSYYLMPDKENKFDPGYYRNAFPKHPPFHIAIVYALYKHIRCCIAAPRGSSKSTVMESTVLLDLLTRPNYWINYFFAKERPHLIECIDRIRYQLETNERILADFGEMKPARVGSGGGIWTNHMLLLANRSRLRGFSMDGKRRGSRADRVILDDIEDDPKKSSDTDARLEDLMQDVLKIIVPMLDSTCSIQMVGTLIHRRSMLYHILSSDEDPRFHNVDKGGDWYKRIYSILDSAGNSIWPEKFTAEALELRRRMMGDSNYRAEFLNDPVSASTQLLAILPDFHEYRLTDVDDAAYQEPFRSGAMLTWNDCSGPPEKLLAKPKSMLWRDFLNQLGSRVITVDPAFRDTDTSDYSCIQVLGKDARDNLWCLDMWHGKTAKLTSLARQIIMYAIRWRVSMIGVESYATQQALVSVIQEELETKYGNSAYIPSVVEVRPPFHLEKGDKIAGLEWRFNYGRIKLPGDRAFTEPYNTLYHQIRDFTRDLKNLRHDDAIDALSLIQWLLGRGGAPGPVMPEPEGPVERYLAGETHDEHGIALASYFKIEDLQPAQRAAIMREIAKRVAWRDQSAEEVDEEPDIEIEDDPENLWGLSDEEQTWM